MQSITSRNTSINRTKAPALFGMLTRGAVAGKTVVDYGCGKWPGMAMATLYNLGAARVISFDPYNYTSTEQALEDVRGEAGVVCLSNVLNVIQNADVRRDVLRECIGLLTPGGSLYVTVYEGDRTGRGRMTGADMWQENRRTADYVWEIHDALPGCTVRRHGRLIEVCRPAEPVKIARKSVQDVDGFWTDYTWYTDGVRHWFIFGDEELYDAGCTPDWECDGFDEALEWFRAYGEEEEV